MRLYLIAPLLAVLVFAGGISPPAQATHNGESHCPQDPNADHQIDFISDLVTFANAFGTADPNLDFWPAPMGDGSVSFTGEIVNVAGMFGQTCIGASSGSGFVQAQALAPFARMGLWGCSYNIWFPGVWFANGYANLANYGGGVGCFHDTGTYTITCNIAVKQLINGAWETKAGFGFAWQPGTVCAGNAGVVASLQCGQSTAGWYSHYITLNGNPYHNEEHWMLNSWDESFVPC